MHTQQPQERKLKKFSKNSYEAALTEKQRDSLHALLFSRLTLNAVRGKTAAWHPRGSKEAKKPELPTLSKIRNRLRLEELVLNVGGISERMEFFKRVLGPMATAANQEKLLDRVMVAISDEVIDLTMERLNPAARTAAARLLLKRADQRQVSRRLKLLETSFAKEKSGVKLTPEEEEERMKQVMTVE